MRRTSTRRGLSALALLVGMASITLPAAAGTTVPEPERITRTHEYDGVQDIACPESLQVPGNALSVDRYYQVSGIRTCVQYAWLPTGANTSRVTIDVATTAPPGATGEGPWRCYRNTALGNTLEPVARAEGCGFKTDDVVARAPDVLEAFPVGFGLAADERGYLLELMARHCSYQDCTFAAPVDVGAAHADNVARMIALGLMGICGTRGGGPNFCPADAVTRADMADFLARALGIPDPGGAPFPDVPDTHPSAAAIRAIAARGITVGNAEGDYAPDLPVRRDQMATFMAKAFNLEGTTDVEFSDVPAAHVHRAGVMAVAAAGITVGCGDGSRFCAGEPIRRDQMATFLAKATD